MHTVLKRGRTSLKAATHWYDQSDTWPWVLGVLGVLADTVVVVAFLHAEPAPLEEPGLPLRGVPPPSLPTFSLVPFAVAGVILVAIYTLVAFAHRDWIVRAYHFVLIVIWLVFSFSWVYYKQGQESADQLTYPNFGHQLSKNEALYFTVGTLTTAGTGNLNARTHDARTAVILQMSLDVIVLVIGVAGLVRTNPRPAPARDTITPSPLADTTPAAQPPSGS